MTENPLGPNIYDDFDDIGEVPGPTPFEKSHFDEKVNTHKDLAIQVGRFGQLRRSIESYTQRGLSVGVALGGPRQVRMFIAEHPDLIKKTAIVTGVAGAVVAGVIYVHERHRLKK